MTAIIWHYRDLRLADNPALHAAAKEYKTIVPLYIDNGSDGAAARVWLHSALQSLNKSYKGALCYRRGDYETVLKAVMEETGAEAIFWNVSYEPEIRAAAKALKPLIRPFNGNYLTNPKTILTAEDKPYQVYTPFRKAAEALYKRRPLLPVPSLNTRTLKSDPIDLLPKINWYQHFPWEIGEEAAKKRLHAFNPSTYAELRNRPDVDGTSRLSPYLHFGEISPAQVVETAGHDKTFWSEMLWREFAAYFLYHFPEGVDKNWKKNFDNFPWEHDPEKLRRWQRGETGFPIVDAGMRQLWQTGWMHNRVRMICASFLIKDLLIDWRHGAAWFSDTLVDADLASNTLGWQWVAGSGPDAAPFFRVFNPTLQQEKFDPNGAYVAEFGPKEPIEPIVDHKIAREKALKIFESIK